MQPIHPFQTRRGALGVVVRISDKQWYLREWHSHRRLEMNLVVRGSGAILLEHCQYPLMPGHLVWLWPGQRHIPADWSDDMLMWIIEWEPRALPLLRRFAPGGIPSASRRTQDIYCRSCPGPTLQRLCGLLEAIDPHGSVEALNAGLHFGLLSLWEAFTRADPVKRARRLHPAVEKSLRLLGESGGAIRATELAAATGHQAHYLGQLFRRETGLSLADYRNRQKLQQFFQLRRVQPDSKLLALALEAGFGSYAQFFRVFRQFTGHNPAKPGGLRYPA